MKYFRIKLPKDGNKPTLSVTIASTSLEQAVTQVLDAYAKFSPPSVRTRVLADSREISEDQYYGRKKC